MIRCGRFSMVGLREPGVGGRLEAGVFPLRCKLWRCANCGPRKRNREIARARRGMRLGRIRFVTITSPAREDGDTSFREFSKRWHRFQTRLQREFGRVVRVEYFAVVERQKRGAAHIHMVYRGPYIPQAWLSAAAKQAGFGKVADIRKAPPNVARYLAKYLTKELSDGPRRRRATSGAFVFRADGRIGAHRSARSDTATGGSSTRGRSMRRSRRSDADT
jgi:hypothetical protein